MILYVWDIVHNMLQDTQNVC